MLVGICLAVYFLLCIAKYILTNYAVHRANVNIYMKMVDSLIKSPVLYFDKTPSGRILNRFTSDMGTMDTQLGYVLIDSIEGPVYCLNLLITIFIFNAWLIIPGVLAVFFLRYFYVYMKPLLIETKKLDMVYKSPVQSYFTSTLSGIVPMRVYR